MISTTSTTTTDAGQSPKIEALPGVYEPQADSEFLREVFFRNGPRIESDVLDICCGSGIHAITAARLGHRVVAVDSESSAITATRRNAAINGVSVEVCQGDLFEPVRGWRFDAILANPPYVPTPPGGDHAKWCDGGPDGRAVIDRICERAGSALRQGGKLWMVQSSLADGRKTLKMLEAHGFDASVADHKLNPLGPVTMMRLGYMLENGYLEPGAQHEKLFVIEAVWLG